MTDADTPEAPESPPQDAPATGPDRPAGNEHCSSVRFRWKSGLVLGTAIAVSLAAANSLAPDETFRVIFLYRTVGVSLVAVVVWWLLMSGVPLRQRVTVLLAAATISAAAGIGLIRRIDFNGAMIPKPVWRWQSSSPERLQEFLPPDGPTGFPADEPVRVTAADWPRYCGRDGSRVISEPMIDRDWTHHPPQLLWRRPVGDAWSSFAVVGPRVFTQEQRGDQECIVCYHADTGHELWIHASSARYETAMGGIGPRATPTVTDTRLFALGATGLLTCLNPQTGRLLWQQNITETADGVMPMWGYSGSPLLYGDTVIVITGGQSGTAAFSVDDGSIVWRSEPHPAGYSSPRLERVGGRVILLAFHGDGLTALNPRSGQPQWHYPFTNMYHVNAAQPIFTEGLIFIGTGYDGQCVALDPASVTDGVPAEAWPPNKNLNLKFNEAVARDGFVYGLDDGILTCVEAATGRRRWKGGRYRHGQVLLWEDVLLVQAEKGYVALVAADPDRFSEISRFPGLSEPDDGIAVRAWNVPVVCRGRLYMRTDRQAACFRLPLSTQSALSGDSPVRRDTMSR